MMIVTTVVSGLRRCAILSAAITLRPDEVPAKNAFLTGKSTAHLGSLGGCRGQYLIDLVRSPLRWQEANPETFDLMGSDGSTGEDGRLGRFGGDVEIRIISAQYLTHAIERVGGTNHLDKGVDLAAGLYPAFLCHRVVAGGYVRAKRFPLSMKTGLLRIYVCIRPS